MQVTVGCRGRGRTFLAQLPVSPAPSLPPSPSESNVRTNEQRKLFPLFLVGAGKRKRGEACFMAGGEKKRSKKYIISERKRRRKRGGERDSDEKFAFPWIVGEGFAGGDKANAFIGRRTLLSREEDEEEERGREIPGDEGENTLPKFLRCGAAN